MKDEPHLEQWLRAFGTQVRRRVRILILLDAADYAVISPIPLPRFHALAFLADVLSPIYHFIPLSGRILKRRTGPYFPDLQWEVDRLIGLNLVMPHGLVPVIDDSNAHVDTSIALHRPYVVDLLHLIYADKQFLHYKNFFRELAGALSNIDDPDLDAATQSDVTWRAGHAGAVIDYAEWRAKNFSSMSTKRLEEMTAESLGIPNMRLSPGAKLNLYAQFLRRAVDPSVAENLHWRIRSARHTCGFLAHVACSSGSPTVKPNHRLKWPGIEESGTAFRQAETM